MDRYTLIKSLDDVLQSGKHKGKKVGEVSPYYILCLAEKNPKFRMTLEVYEQLLAKAPGIRRQIKKNEKQIRSELKKELYFNGWQG